MIHAAHRVTEGKGTMVFQWRCRGCSNENPCPKHGTRGWTSWLMELLFLLAVGPMSLFSPLSYINHYYYGKCGVRLFIYLRLFIWITVILVYFHLQAKEQLKCKTTQNIWNIWQYIDSKVLQSCEASCFRKDPKEDKTWSRSKHRRAGLYRKDDIRMRHGNGLQTPRGQLQWWKEWFVTCTSW